MIFVLRKSILKCEHLLYTHCAALVLTCSLMNIVNHL